MFFSVVLLFLFVLCISTLKYVEANVSPSIVKEWNTRQLSPVSQLALVPGNEFPFLEFNPPLLRRGDGATFVSVALVEHPEWIGLALNSLVSLSRFANVRGVTVMTVGDPNLADIFNRVGLYTYNANTIVGTFPADFLPDKHIPNWSWGEIIFLRFNLWIESFRRGIGFCSLDLDVTYNKNVIFPTINGKFADISMQGKPWNPAVVPKSYSAREENYQFNVKSE
jgi:hypothetical protein